jgi:hypothetical protein
MSCWDKTDNPYPKDKHYDWYVAYELGWYDAQMKLLSYLIDNPDVRPPYGRQAIYRNDLKRMLKYLKSQELQSE